MKTHNERVRNILEWLNAVYDFINFTFFESALTKPVITIAPDDKRKMAGWFVPSNVWKLNSEDSGDVEINICATAFDKSPLDVCEVMLHEMCHQFAFVNQLQDCSRAGVYHNKVFARIAAQHGLVANRIAKYGYADTALTENSKKALTPICEGIELVYRLPVAKGSKVSSSSTRKYVCPECNQSVRATKTVNIMCLDCNKTMQTDEE